MHPPKPTKLLVSATSEPVRRDGLIRLRCGFALGLIAIFLPANEMLQLGLSYIPLLSIVLFTALTNVFLANSQFAFKSHGIILLDILLLTALLYCYGGYNNPFSMLYLVYVTIAALFLGSRWTWTSLALSTVCFSSLFFWYNPVQAFSMHEHNHMAGQMSGFSFHLQGMLVAFLLIGFLVAYFITRMASELETLRSYKNSEDKLSALASLTAGAAHELATPLGTVFLIAEELGSNKDSDTPIKSFKTDIVELEQQLARAKDVLSRMRSRSPDLQGEMQSDISVTNLIDDVLVAFPEEEKLRIEIRNDARDETIHTLAISMRESLIVLIKNALEVSVGSRVSFAAQRAGGSVRFSVRDFGPPIPVENLEKMGEPFFTTKPPGQGMGLGLYLVKTFANQVKGQVVFSPQEPGLMVSLTVPS